jgi:hypothetical protein
MAPAFAFRMDGLEGLACVMASNQALTDGRVSEQGHKQPLNGDASRAGSDLSILRDQLHFMLKQGARA